MKLVNTEKNKDSGGGVVDSKNIEIAARKLGWDKVKWLKSRRGLQLKSIKKAAFVESRDHILMLGKMHEESKVGVVIIAARCTSRKLGWLNNILSLPVRTKFYGFDRHISVHSSFHSSLKSSWSGKTSNINEIKENGGILETLDSWINDFKDKNAKDIQIIVTGHSQGGAMANLISAKLIGEGHIKRLASLFNVSDENRLWLIAYGVPAVIKGGRGWCNNDDTLGSLE